ncbi:TonB system transport protein ExbD [Thiorhodococcus minor]|nr:TonB system transport protein ExbD [Thiorhodococcus minor]
MDQINVIPFIDIMLVLLAIVLTTATFISEGRLEIRLPESKEQAQQDAERRLEIAIDADGNLYVDAEPLSLEQLTSQLDGLSSDTPVVLRVDAATRFDRFVAIIDELKARQLERLSILTQRS